MFVPFTIIIPARYASSRLPGKPLLDIKGKSLIRHVFETASRSRARQIFIATDDERIAKAAESFNAPVVMTSTAHHSGTERLAEAVSKLGLGDDEIIVNLQGDEYGMPAVLLDQVASDLDMHPDRQMATLCEAITSSEDYQNPNVVKLVMDRNNNALYFSRSPVPADHSRGLPEKIFRHIGVYAYRATYLKRFINLAPCELEQFEALEQLRALYHGDKIHLTVVTDKTGIGIDTPEDIERARAG